MVLNVYTPENKADELIIFLQKVLMHLKNNQKQKHKEHCDSK